MRLDLRVSLTCQLEHQCGMRTERVCVCVCVCVCVVDEQYILYRLANAAIDIYAMAAVLSR